MGATAMLMASPRAGAHALLVSSDPADGVSLAAAPASVTLAFTEEPDVGLSRIQVLDASGARRERGSPDGTSPDPRSLRVDVGALERGVYTVSWRVVSRVDGHLTGGAFAFGVGVAAVAGYLSGRGRLWRRRNPTRQMRRQRTRRRRRR